jgi:queuine tRNA-ribosyltransferase/7-cyano-7-deazaguanine tRNA-ribosyltransferase
MERPGFSFEILKEGGAARLARYETPHGVMNTPTFVAVGTQAAVKGVMPETVAATGTQVLFANTYHLYLRPGQEVVSRHGGLHSFMNWRGPIMTDSGGFQVFSLGASIVHGVGKVASIFPAEAGIAPAVDRSRIPQGNSLVEVGEEEVRFISHVDGSRHIFTPEKSISIQRALGADIVLAFDECTSPLHDDSYTKRSAERTHRWAQRCLAYFERHPPQHGYEQALYGIVQGGAVQAIRQESSDVIAAMPFDGIAIGGNLGKSRQEMYQVLDWTLPRLPVEKPRHLLGIGDVPSLFEAVERGCDTFDCVAPTRNARNGAVFCRFDDDGTPLTNFRLNLRNARFASDLEPVDATCDCPTCRGYSRAYLRHLFKADEQLAQQLATVHNLRFMARLCEDIRQSLREGTFQELKRSWLEHLPQT